MSDGKLGSSVHHSMPVDTQPMPAKVCNTRHAYRDFTSYGSTCSYSNTLNKMMHFNTTQEANQWQTDNAEKIMDYERMSAFRNLMDCHPSQQVHSAQILAPLQHFEMAEPIHHKSSDGNPHLAAGK